MWIAKFKLKDDEDIYSPLCEDYGIDFFAYPITNFKKKNKINLIVVGNIFGEGVEKKKFLRELKKDKRVKSIEKSGDFIVVHAVHPINKETTGEITTFYNRQYVMVNPVHVSKDGWEYWEIGCLDRKELMKIITASEKHYHGKLLSLKEEKLSAVSIINIFPNLTKKQKECLEIAYKNKYYNYPRKLTIQELSKEINRSYSTFQEHLRKAEKKIIESFLKTI